MPVIQRPAIAQPGSRSYSPAFISDSFTLWAQRNQQIASAGQALEGLAAHLAKAEKARQALDEQNMLDARYIRAVKDMEQTHTQITATQETRLQGRTIFDSVTNQQSQDWFKGLNPAQTIKLEKDLVLKRLQYQHGAAQIEDGARLDQSKANLIELGTMAEKDSTNAISDEDVTSGATMQRFIETGERNVRDGILPADEWARLRQSRIENAAYSRGHRLMNLAPDAIVSLADQELATPGSTYLKDLRKDALSTLREQGITQSNHRVNLLYTQQQRALAVRKETAYQEMEVQFQQKKLTMDTVLSRMTDLGHEGVDHFRTLLEKKEQGPGDPRAIVEMGILSTTVDPPPGTEDRIRAQMRAYLSNGSAGIPVNQGIEMLGRVHAVRENRRDEGRTQAHQDYSDAISAAEPLFKTTGILEYDDKAQGLRAQYQNELYKRTVGAPRGKTEDPRAVAEELRPGYVVRLGEAGTNRVNSILSLIDKRYPTPQALNAAKSEFQRSGRMDEFQRQADLWFQYIQMRNAGMTAGTIPADTFRGLEVEHFQQAVPAGAAPAQATKRPLRWRP